MPPRKTKPEPKQIVLNEEQQAVVGARQGIFAVLAGPGSGKTFAATHRMAAIIKEGVSPDDTLALSFTAVAAKNLKAKVEEITGPLSINRTAGSMTLHSLALKFVEGERNEFKFKLEEFPLATEPIANRLSAESARRYEVDPRSLRSVVSVYKRNRVRPSEAIRTSENNLKANELKLALAYADYEKRLRSAGVLDFDSIMLEMVELLDKRPDVRSRWQYLYVTFDEAQDGCKTDWQLLKLLTEKHRNLMCVGDPGQNIYSFRGSDSGLFLNMDDMFPGTKKLFLATNYRSSPEVVALLKTIGPVPELATRFHTTNPSGPVPIVKGFLSPGDEAAWIVSEIKRSNNE